MTLQVELVSPEQVLYTGEAAMVVARTIGGGDIAFQTGHAAFVGALETYVVKIIKVGGETEMAAVHGGFVSVQHDRVTILSDLAELASQIDARRAEAAHDRAEQAVQRLDDTEAEAALRRSNARLLAAGAMTA
jgi:F-type H+-transporting ATPase subunit epsilon